MISFLQHLDEAVAPKLDIKQFPHVVNAVSNNAKVLRRLSDVLALMNTFVGKDIPNPTYLEDIKYPITSVTELAVHTPEWIYEMLRASGGSRPAWYNAVDMVGTYPHTVPGKLKKLIAARTTYHRDPDAKKYFDYYIPIFTELEILSAWNETMKGQAVKRQPKPVEDRHAKYIAPMMARADTKLVLDVLTEMTEKIKIVYAKNLTAMWLERADNLNSMTPSAQRAHRMTRNPDILWSFSIWNRTNTFTLIPGYKKVIQKAAVESSEAMQKEFLFKNAAKLGSIVQAKNVALKKPKILSLTASRGTYEGDVLFTFKDGSSFTVRNKVVLKMNAYGTFFNQFPTTFHDVILPNGKAMGLPSEERMNTVFVSESRHEPLQMDVENTSRDGNDRITFHEFLQEDKSGKLMHLTHLEDLMLDEGLAGMRRAIEVLREFRNMLIGGGVSKAMHVTTKWDGAPSVVFGPDPADGKFFVATKSAFSKAPKLMKSHADVTDTYGSEGVAQVLHDCLSELALLHPTHVLQGDLLFSGGRGVKSQSIDGTNYLTFRPNTILYAVGATSALGQHISRAALGIVIHTMYAGAGTLEHLHATPITPAVFSALKKTNRVVALDAAYDDVSGNATFTTDEDAEFSLLLSRIGTLAQRIPALIYTTLMTEPLHAIVNMFLNQQVRGGHAHASKQTLDALSLFLSARQDKEMSSRSSAEGKEKVRQTFTVMLDAVRTNQQAFAEWFELHTAITDAKLLVIRKLAQASRVQTFIPTADGFRVTGPEGFVAVSHAGKMVKLVDRLEFSRANFLAPKEWK